MERVQSRSIRPTMSYSFLRRPKKQKGNDSATPLLYPHIPEGAQDLEASRGFPLIPEWVMLGCETNVIMKSDSTEWGNPSLAIARAALEPAVTPQNEALIRTYHPALSVIPTVYTHTEMTGNIIWKVPLPEGLRLSHTHVAGREVHIMPSVYTPNPLEQLMPPRVPIRRLIYPRRMLTASDISILRASYPASIGVRVYISGWVVVLFQNKADMYNAAKKSGCPDDIGGLNVGYDTIAVEPTAVTTQSGRDVSHSPDSLDTRGSLGLRIRGQDGTEAITTVTHGFVKRPDHHPIFLTLADRLAKAKERLSGFMPLNIRGALPGEVESGKNSSRNSALGASVYLPGELEKIGTITTSYDDPSSILPFPAGYRHDLSLFTGPNLPHVTSPAGVGPITDWAEYEDALDGKPVFITRFDTWINRNRRESGRISTDATKHAMIEGADYFWVEQAVSASLIWRTDEDYRDMKGSSGAVLCLGRPTDQNIKAVVFQNYTTPVKKWQVRGDEAELKGEYGWKMKGGFLLPQEVRESQIISNEPPTAD